MRLLFITLTVIVAACAANTTDLQSSKTLRSSKNQPHLPPPDFESIENKDQIATIPETRVPYLHYNIEDRCGETGELGSKRFPPDTCDVDYKLVCGCDGKTYGNACGANSSGVSVRAMGECRG